MRFRHLLIATLASAGVTHTVVAQEARVAPWNHVSLCVTTAIGRCGTLCEPFACQPNFTLVSSHETMVFDVAAAPGTFYLLFVGVAVPGCMPIPGIAGALATWTPTQTLRLGVLTELQQRFDLPCTPGHAQFTHSIPAVAPGYDVRYQLLGMNQFAMTAPVLSFSRPTEVRTR